jgi:predicted MFS family arabinose efflux permease
MLRSLMREYATALARFAPDARRFLAAVALSAFARQSFAVLRNLYLKELGLGEDRIGLIVSALSIGQALIAIPAIVILARLGLRRALILAAMAELVGAAIQIGGGSFAPLIIATGIAGAASTLHSITAQPYLMAASSGEERPYLFSSSFTSMMIAGAIGSSAGGALQEAVAYALGDRVLGFRVALAISALGYVAALSRLVRLRADEPAADVAAPSLLAALRVRSPSRIALIVLPEAIIGLGAGLSIPFLQLYFRNTFSLGSGAIGAIYMLGYGGMAAGYLIAPAIARRLGTRATIVGSQLVSILFFFELAFPHALGLAIVAFVLRTTFMNLNAPVHSQYCLELVDPADQRAVSSFLSLVRGITWAVANSVGGYIIHARGGDFSPTLVLTAILYVIAAVVGARVYADLEATKRLHTH